MCEDSLSQNLNVGNVATVLMLADMHSADQLKNIAISFCNANSKEVVETEGWKQMCSQNPHLISDAYKSLAEGTNPSQIDPLSSPPRKRIKSAQNWQKNYKHFYKKNNQTDTFSTLVCRNS